VKRPSYRWRCHSCGEVFTAWATVQRHVDEDHGHGRIECDNEKASPEGEATRT
jgi:uncharacterized C2H2 Zn-finger protein